MGRCQQRNECWDSASVYHSLGLFWCPRSNVSEGPSRFELNGTTISSSQEGHKFWNQTSPDYVVNRGLLFPRKQFPMGKQKEKQKLKVINQTSSYGGGGGTQQFKMPTRDQTSSYKKHNLKCILIQEFRTLSNLLQWRLNAEISWNLRETEQTVCMVLPQVVS